MSHIEKENTEDVIIISDSECPKVTQTNKPKNKKKRKVIIRTTNDSMETVIITQENDIKNNYRINLELNEEEYKEKRELKIASMKERAVPECTRPECNKSRGSSKGNISVSRRRQERLKKCHRYRKSSYKSYHTSRHRHGYHKKRNVPTKNIIHLSPILSLSAYEDSNIYEDISSVADDIDTLIKRSKKREQLYTNLNQTLENQDNEYYDSISSDEEHNSIHSKATILLESILDEAYSPTMSPRYIMSPLFQRNDSISDADLGERYVEKRNNIKTEFNNNLCQNMLPV